MKTEVKRTLLRVFRTGSEDLGFEDIEVDTFKNGSPASAYLSVNLDVKAPASDNGSTIALYAAVYDGSLILTDTAVIDAIFRHINDTVLPGLKNETIAGSSVDEEYIDNVVVKELEEEKESLEGEVCDPCNSSESVCEVTQRCYTDQSVEECKKNSQGTIQIACLEPCYVANDPDSSFGDADYLCDGGSQVCHLDESQGLLGTCTCKTNYLPAVGNDYKCFHQDILIGVCVGVGGALIIGLVMLTVYFACKSSKAELTTKGPELTDLMDDDIPSGKGGIDGFSVTSDGSLPPEGRTQQSSGQPVGIEDVEIVGTDYDNVRATTSAALFSTDEDNPEYMGIPERDVYNRGEVEDDTLREIMESDTYKNFQPQLENIDPYAPMFANRPRINLIRDDDNTRTSGVWHTHNLAADWSTGYGDHDPYV